MVLPVGKVQGLHLADVRDAAVDPRTVQTDEDPQGAGAPTRIFREEREKEAEMLSMEEGRRGCERETLPALSSDLFFEGSD